MRTLFKRNSRRSGIALVMVMLVVMILTVVAGAFAYRMRVEMRLARHVNNDADLEWIARSAVERVKFLIGQKERIPLEANYEANNQIWAGGTGATNSVLSEFAVQPVEINGGSYTYKVFDNESKFNINLADETVLRQALILMGVDAGEFPTIVDSILDWIDTDNNTHIAGAETDYYMSLPTPYVAKNGLIDDIFELELIKGITPAMFWGPAITGVRPSRFAPGGSGSRPVSRRAGEEAVYPVGLKDLFTAISGGRININRADATMLQIIPDVDANTAQAIINWRNGPDGVPGTEDDQPFRNVGELRNVGAFSQPMIAAVSRYADVRSHTFQIEIEVEYKGTKRHYDALIRRSNQDPSDFVVVQFSWK
jgi:type II secretory pathway component PulK